MTLNNSESGDQPWTAWPARWEAALDACGKLGGETPQLVIKPPATNEELERVEAELGMRLPESFRTVLSEFSSTVELRWHLPDVWPPGDLRQIFSGECRWDLSELPELEENRRGWIDVVFPNIDDPYDRVWHNKLTFLAVANGDMLALDLSAAPECPVIYLSHECDEAHGYILGDNFIDFIDRWSLLGCPGSEDWQLTPFISSPTSGIDPNCENARKWREWFGLHI